MISIGNGDDIKTLQSNLGHATAAPAIPGEKYGKLVLPDTGLHLLSKGTAGPEVRAAQVLLNMRGAALGTDGDFGGLTKAAVRAFQKDSGLEEDGIVGRDTWRALLTRAG